MTATDALTGSDLAVTPDPILKLASGFMAAKHLFAANELGLFEALADGPAPLPALAARTGLTERATRISADAMVALGLLDHDGTAYRNKAVADSFLAGAPGPDLRPFLRFWDRISYPAWQGLAQALATGPAQEIFALDDESQGVVSAGIEAILQGPAHALGGSDLLRDRSRLLDVGGGTGSWSIAACMHHAQLRATVVDLPIQYRLRERRLNPFDGNLRLTCSLRRHPENLRHLQHVAGHSRGLIIDGVDRFVGKRVRHLELIAAELDHLAAFVGREGREV